MFDYTWIYHGVRKYALWDATRRELIVWEA